MNLSCNESIKIKINKEEYVCGWKVFYYNSDIFKISNILLIYNRSEIVENINIRSKLKTEQSFKVKLNFSKIYTYFEEKEIHFHAFLSNTSNNMVKGLNVPHNIISYNIDEKNIIIRSIEFLSKLYINKVKLNIIIYINKVPVLMITSCEFQILNFEFEKYKTMISKEKFNIITNTKEDLIIIPFSKLNYFISIYLNKIGIKGLCTHIIVNPNNIKEEVLYLLANAKEPLFVIPQSQLILFLYNYIIGDGIKYINEF